MESSDQFNLPDHWQTYYADIKDRCRNLISTRIWNGIEHDKLNAWLKNFRTDREKYISACLLDSLMYRSSSKTKALIYNLFNVVLPNYTRINPTPIGSIKNWFDLLSDQEDPLIRLVAVMTDHDTPIKSSSQVLRLLSKEFSINSSWIIHPNKIRYYSKTETKTFVFIDDFLGSGDQFAEIVSEYDLHNLSAYVLYAPLVAHEVGIEKIHKDFQNRIPIVASENLTRSMNFFDTYFNKDADLARQFYIQMFKNRGINYSKDEDYFGHGNLQLAYSFELGCPDNTLKVFWLKHENWNPLFDR